jgi:hypothetical protein
MTEELEKVIPKDKFDNTIEVGDDIAHPVSMGGAILRKYTVYAIEYERRSMFNRKTQKYDYYLHPALKVNATEINWKKELRNYKTTVHHWKRSLVIRKHYD